MCIVVRSVRDAQLYLNIQREVENAILESVSSPVILALFQCLLKDLVMEVVALVEIDFPVLEFWHELGVSLDFNTTRFTYFLEISWQTCCKYCQCIFLPPSTM